MRPYLGSATSYDRDHTCSCLGMRYLEAMQSRPKGNARRRSLGTRLGLVVALALVALAPRAAQASVVEALDLPGLVANAKVIVLGKAVAEQSHYDEHGRIVTDVELIVETCEKGGLQPGASIVVRRLGGVVNGIGMRIEGEPTFQIGERTLLFGEGSQKALRPVGMSQGAMRVSEVNGQTWVRSAAAGLALMKRTPDGKLVKSQASMNEPKLLADVLAEVRALVTQSAR